MANESDFISCIIPVYDEDETVVQNTVNDLIEGFSKVDFKNYDITIVNDGSKESFDYSKINNVNLIYNNRNKGYGAAIKNGLKHVKGNWVLITDADGTYPNKEVGSFIQYMSNHDMVVGARQHNKNAVPLSKRIAKSILKLIIKIIAQYKVPDLNSGLRLFKKEMAMEFFHLYPNGFSFTSTITLAALSNDYDVKYIPIPYYKRVGESSIKVKDFFGFVVLIIRMITQFKPLKIFLPLSFTLLTMGIIKLIRDMVLRGAIGSATVLFITIALQILLLGMVADMICLANKKQRMN